MMGSSEKSKWLRAMKGHLMEENPEKLSETDREVTEFVDENSYSVGMGTYAFMGAIAISLLIPFFGFALSCIGIFYYWGAFTSDGDNDE